jgi:hypothetical protein
MNGYEYQTSIPLNRIDDQGLWSRTISEGAETIQDESPGYRLNVKIEYDKNAIPKNASHIVQVTYARVVGMDMTCTLLFDDKYYVSDVWNWGPLKCGLGNEYLIDNRASFSKGSKREQIEWNLLYVEVHSEIGILTTSHARKSLGPALIG